MRSLIFIPCLFFNAILFAQNGLISNGGETFVTPSVKLSISIGEPVAAYSSTVSVRLSQGYQQGYTESILAAEKIDFKALRVSSDSVQLNIFLENKANEVLKVQKSLDGYTFLGLKIEDKMLKDGHIMDFNDQPFPTYYRLEMVDNMGKISYSPIRVVEGARQVFYISPNPVNDILTLVLDKNAGFNSGFMEILNSQGQVLRTKTFSKSSEKVQIPVSDLPTGLYFCRLNDSPIALKFYKN